MMERIRTTQSAWRSRGGVRGPGRGWRGGVWLCLLAIAVGTAGAELGPAPAVLLDPVFSASCRRPCEYVGFSFSETPDAMREMVAHGANAVGTGSMWVPTPDPTAPHGAGLPDLSLFDDVRTLGQAFRCQGPVQAVGMPAPTFFSKGSGCTLSLYQGSPDTWAENATLPIVSQLFKAVSDNQLLWLTGAELPAGEYYLEQSAPTGPGIGVWAAGRDVLAGGQAYVNRQARPGEDLEVWCRTAAGDKPLAEVLADHHALRLGPGLLTQIGDAGLAVAYSVGNWNNGGFPYYPGWFLERYPDMAMLDQDRQPLLCGMFGTLSPWPGLDHPVIVDGTERYIRAVVARLRDQPHLLYWVMGGEALYATYLMPDRWTDYSDDATAHYRAWLRQTYGSAAALNAAWGTPLADIAEATPPRAPGRDRPTLDWFRFRNLAMAERFQSHFIATKATDPARLVMSCNHGDLFAGMAATRLGQDLALFADVSDGWEMGQIIADEDADRFNLLWMRAAGSFGKPLCPVRLAYRHSDPRARGGGTSYTPDAAHRYFWESVGTGAWHLGFIQWSGDLPDGEWGVRGTPAQAEIREILTRWHEVAPTFDDLWPVAPKVGLFLSQPTWTLDGFQPVWRQLHNELTRRQIDVRLLVDRALCTGDLGDLAVIVVAGNRILSTACLQALLAFQARGGELVLIGENGLEDEGLRPRQPPPFPQSAPLTAAVEAVLASRAESAARWLRVACTVRERFTETRSEATTDRHDTPYDLAAHGAVSQTFVASQAGLVAVAVSNPTYTKALTAGALTAELRAGSPDGTVLASRAWEAAELKDNAWHELRLPQPAPPGTLCLRLTASPGLPAEHLGVWGTREDRYPGGTLILGTTPAPGDLEMRLTYESEPATPSRVIEAFPLSDGLNLAVVLINTAAGDLDATLTVSPDLLPAGGGYAARELLTGADLGRIPDPAAATVQVPVPKHRARVVYLAAPVTGDARTAIAECEAALAVLPPDATAAPRAHLQRAREALVGGRIEKAWACLGRAKARAPLAVHAEVADGRLRVRASSPGDTATDGRLEASLVPLPGGLPGRLARLGPGEYAAEVPLPQLGQRYDYARREYRPYSGALEVIVQGRIGQRVAGASCVVVV